MDRDRLEEWIQEKLDEGFSEERIKKSLENTGHDPSLVDEVKDPFSSVEEEPDVDLDREEDEGFDRVEESSGEDYKPDSEGDQDSGSGFSMPSLSLPVPGVRHLKYIALLSLLLSLVTAVFFLPAGQMANDAVQEVESGIGQVNTSIPDVEVPDVDNPVSDNGDSRNTASQKEPGCTNPKLRIESVSEEDGTTFATVLVVRGPAPVTLEVLEDDRVVGSTTREVSGEEEMAVEATGSRVKLHPEGCTRFWDDAFVG